MSVYSCPDDNALTEKPSSPPRRRVIRATGISDAGLAPPVIIARGINTRKATVMPLNTGEILRADAEIRNPVMIHPAKAAILVSGEKSPRDIGTMATMPATVPVMIPARAGLIVAVFLLFSLIINL